MVGGPNCWLVCLTVSWRAVLCRVFPSYVVLQSFPYGEHGVTVMCGGRVGVGGRCGVGGGEGGDGGQVRPL